MTEKENRLQKPLCVALLALVCTALWGSAGACIKLGYELFDIRDTASRILFAGCRFALAGVLVIVLGSLLSRRPLLPKKGSARYILILASVQTVAQYVFYYIGLSLTAGVRASILNGSGNFLAILIACFLARSETFTRQKLLGCLVGLAGVVLVSLGSEGLGEGSFTGDGAVLLAAAAYGASSVLIKKYSQYEDPVVLSGCQFLLGGLVMMLGAWCCGGRIRAASPAAIPVLLHLALVSAVAYSLWGILLKHNPVGRIAVYGFTTPIFGVALSAILLHEGAVLLSPRIPIALALVSLGIILVNRTKE